jgi:predicted PurR-regulated permease PerM
MRVRVRDPRTRLSWSVRIGIAAMIVFFAAAIYAPEEWAAVVVTITLAVAVAAVTYEAVSVLRRRRAVRRHSAM